jgi:hypothetical protein
LSRLAGDAGQVDRPKRDVFAHKDVVTAPTAWVNAASSATAAAARPDPQAGGVLAGLQVGEYPAYTGLDASGKLSGTEHGPCSAGWGRLVIDPQLQDGAGRPYNGVCVDPPVESRLDDRIRVEYFEGAKVASFGVFTGEIGRADAVDRDDGVVDERTHCAGGAGR